MTGCIGGYIPVGTEMDVSMLLTSSMQLLLKLCQCDRTNHTSCHRTPLKDEKETISRVCGVEKGVVRWCGIGG